MKSSSKDQIAGKAHEIKGNVKEVAGRIIGNPRLENEGAAEKLGGKVQKKIGEVKKVLGQ